MPVSFLPSFLPLFSFLLPSPQGKRQPRCCRQNCEAATGAGFPRSSLPSVRPFFRPSVLRSSLPYCFPPSARPSVFPSFCPSVRPSFQQKGREAGALAKIGPLIIRKAKTRRNVLGEMGLSAEVQKAVAAEDNDSTTPAVIID
jgi:hypothetical protein